MLEVRVPVGESVRVVTVEKCIGQECDRNRVFPLVKRFDELLRQLFEIFELFRYFCIAWSMLIYVSFGATAGRLRRLRPLGSSAGSTGSI